MIEIGKKFWTAFAILTVALIIISSIIWIVDHPFGISWDEAGYFNRVIQDQKRIDQVSSKFFGGGIGCDCR